jgi:amino acid transporter
MFERLKRRPGGEDRAGTTSAGAGTAAPPEEREGTPGDTAAVRRSREEGAPTSPGPAAVARAHERQREAYGGINWGAAFFGWLVAVGMAVLLTGLLGAAGAAIGLTGVSDANVAQQSDTLTLGGALALLIVLILAYACGGYVSGRMSRFDGARQGVGAWIIGLLVTLVIAAVALVAGAQYNVVARANLPRLPVGDQTLSAGGAVATVVILVATLAAAALGGKLGERYHRKVDRAGFPG